MEPSASETAGHSLVESSTVAVDILTAAQLGTLVEFAATDRTGTTAGRLDSLGAYLAAVLGISTVIEEPVGQTSGQHRDFAAGKLVKLA